MKMWTIKNWKTGEYKNSYCQTKQPLKAERDQLNIKACEQVWVITRKPGT